MEMTARKLLTIVTEAAIEDTLVRDLEQLGARGYTITDARGKGSGGKRDATWGPHANIRLEVLCDAATALAICAALRERYSDNYSMVMYVGDVDVLRPAKF
ncbi:MAG: transcriptional regulator [Polaromonas sp.]|uniref:P-II family nitrogen regulator n=1 Tax=Polaromonas sp. TaxID=1869339 RepID=UPI0027307A71|nr:transcriptional regulator [Polaromonas sp.]MDP1742603.1 transcriptional regulator [Polaromonas sp.]MDP1955629.1 transcriptional regulator [Polaromonas sp.]MDP3356073.1 transcriptional regulator [Polaromonas sp.]MDP3752479.1 transcriptional regulator [Polaromonas sp.]